MLRALWESLCRDLREWWASLRWGHRAVVQYLATMVLFAILMTACIWAISHVLPMRDEPRPRVSIEHAGELGITREELDGRLSDGR